MRLIDGDGAEGWGECAALAAPGYSTEWADGAFVALRDHLVPALLAARSFPTAGAPMAAAAVEMARVDLALRRRGRSLASRLGARRSTVPWCAVVGRQPDVDTLLGVVGDVVAMKIMERRMDPVAAEPLHQGKAGTMLKWSEGLVLAGGLGTLLAGRNRAVAAASGLALLAGSALTRFGVFEAGLASAKDPRYTIEPQKRRLAERRAAGITGDAITTGS